MKPSFARTKAFDQRRSQSSSQPHFDSVLVIRGVHVTVTHEHDSDLVFLEKRKGSVRIPDGGWPILIHGVGCDGIVREPFVHSDEDDLLRPIRGFQIFFQPSQLFGAKPLSSSADVIQRDEVNAALEIRGIHDFIVERSKIHRYLDESVLECFHPLPALGCGPPEKPQTLDLMVPHHGIERKRFKVFELRQEERIFRGRKLQVAEKEERLSAPPLGFLKGPRYNVRAIVP